MLSQLFNKFRLPLPLIGLCVGVFISVVVTAFASQQLMARKLQATGDQYGASLANIASRQAIDALLDRDLISLQVILGDISENPDVVVATIHDIENKLLAQAGNADAAKLRNLRGSDTSIQRTFTAPITLQNSVAGYVTVTIDQTSTVVVKRQLYWLFCLSGFLLLALTITAYYFGDSRHYIRPNLGSTHDALDTSGSVADTPAEPPTNDEPNISESKPESSGVKALSEVSDINIAQPELEKEAQTCVNLPGDIQPNPAVFRVELIFRLHNLRALKQQLSQFRFQNLQTKLNSDLKNALPLYSGEMLNKNEQQVIFLFESVDSIDESIFHASCYVFLLMALSEQNDFPVEFNAAISEIPSEIAADMSPNGLSVDKNRYLDSDSLLASCNSGELLLSQSLLEATQLTHKLSYDLSNAPNGYARVVGIQEPYQQLLQKQVLQLRNNRSDRLPIYSAS